MTLYLRVRPSYVGPLWDGKLVAGEVTPPLPVSSPIPILRWWDSLVPIPAELR